MKKNILIFAGTTEGRQLAEYTVKKGIPCIVSAATEYGEELLENDLQLQKEKHKKSELRVIQGRMDQQEMEASLKRAGGACHRCDASVCSYSDGKYTAGM